MNVAILVTGDRHATPDRWQSAVNRIELEIYGYANEDVRFGVIIHGDCKGIDRMAGDLAEYINCHPLPMPYIDGLGHAGGPARNAQMVAVLTALKIVGYRTVCMAFHDSITTSKGTRNCARQAIKAGHKTFLVTSDGNVRRITMEDL